jgi:hypothetical protein
MLARSRVVEVTPRKPLRRIIGHCPEGDSFEIPGSHRSIPNQPSVLYQKRMLRCQFRYDWDRPNGEGRPNAYTKNRYGSEEG